MYELMRANQLNIMLLLCGACVILALLLAITRFLTKQRKAILILMELIAFFLLWFDRLAYIYAGDPSQIGFVMVRISNFAVFFLTSCVVFGLNLYIKDILRNDLKLEVLPRRHYLSGALSIVGMVLAVVAAFTDLYYYFDANNTYHRGEGFLIAYIIPVICPILQYTVIRQYKKKFSKPIYISIVLYIFVPIACGILQIFTYGISIVNMSMVAVSISLYIFMYFDLNNKMQHAHEIEIQNLQGEQARMHRLFDQTATAFVTAVEEKDDYAKGNAVRIAEYAKKIALLAGKSEADSEKAYYAALLHDVGLIGVPDEVIKRQTDPVEGDYEEMRKKPLIGAEILSSITEYPYLSLGAHYSHERYNGTGYPEKLKGEEIPEIARIVAVADAYVTMTTKKRYRDARMDFEAREAFVKGMGEAFDPVFSDLMIKIIDSEMKKNGQDQKEELEKELVCPAYREIISCGIPVKNDVIKISFDCEMPLDEGNKFSSPSIVLFDAYDGRVHDNKRSIESYHYLEYGEIWFDRYSVTTEARQIEESIIEEGDKASHYEILAGRYEDHLRLVMRSGSFAKEVIVALPMGSKDAYIGLTGENCKIKNILAEPTGETIGSEEIQRIVEPVSFIDHLEADIHNVQVDSFRSAYSEGVELKGRLKITFCSMTLPDAAFVWCCPYIVLYSSKDGSIGGEDYREYALVKLSGENESSDEFAQNHFVMKKDNFTGWEDWRRINQNGTEYEAVIEKKGNSIVLKAENLGLSIENTSVLKEGADKFYVALTGDEVALTDIRVEYR